MPLDNLIVLIIVLCALVFMGRHIYKGLRKGQCACGCGCEKNCRSRIKVIKD